MRRQQQQHRRRRLHTLALDLDETMVHVRVDEVRGALEVWLRPGLGLLLRYLGARGVRAAVYTAACAEYAWPIVDMVERDAGVHFHRRLCDLHLTPDGRKDVARHFGADGCTVLVDDNPRHAELQPQDVWLLPPFRGDPRDRELVRVLLLLARHVEVVPPPSSSTAARFNSRTAAPTSSTDGGGGA